MAKKMLIDATHAEETRVVVVDGNKVEEFDFESENKRQLAGNIYLAKVTRVEPSLQAAFVDYGGNRHGFLAFSEIHPDYYQIPVADREALMEEERAYAESLKARDEEEEKPKSRSRRSRSRKKKSEDQVATEAAETAAVEATSEEPVAEISGMETIDLVEDAGGDEDEGLSPMELVEETPVEEPAEAEAPEADAEAEVDAEAAGVASAEAEEVAEEEAAEEAPVAEGETSEDSEAAEPEDTADAEEPVDAAAEETSEDGGDKDEGPKTIAANTEGEDAVVSKDPETGEETETEASAAPEGDDAAEADVAVEEAVEETEAAAPESDENADSEVEPVEESAVEEAPEDAEAETAQVEEVEPAAEEPEVAGDAADSSEEASESAAQEEETVADAAPEADAEAADGADDADADADSEASSDDEDTGKKSGRRRSRRRGKRSEASEKDESIESVADEDDSEDIRPPRKPRPRRYKIQEVIKVRQIMLVQVVKEERGNKGAALTTYLSLAGRYCVLMPNTARGGGISRKITNAADRKKLKEISNEIDVPQGAGLIVRTAGAKRTKSEIKRDYEYLQRLWEQIRELTLKSTAPAKIYEEGDLIKRSIRDLYSREIDEVLVEGERGYRIAKDFMKMIMPSHAKNVKRYQDSLPLLARYQVESYLSGMFNPTVQLKSGGYIVIGVTEALVAIDVNSGRATKEGSIEETALKTNLEAAEEVARQLRLRDLAGLIVIDFIDMDERKNNTAVEKRMKDKLKTDRARIQVGRISGFGLMEMSRQRLRPGMIEATTQPCPACHGTGLIRSDDNLALSILRQIEEEGTRGRSREVLVKAPVAIVNYLMNQKREHVAQIEARYGLSVRIEADPHLVSPDFSIEKFKTATRVVSAPEAPVVSGDISIMDAIDDADVEDAEVISEEKTESEEGEAKPKKRRRRRRRRRGNGENGEGDASGDTSSEGDADPIEEGDASEGGDDRPAEEAAEGEEKPKKRSRSRRSRSRGKKSEAASEEVSAEDAADEAPAADAAEAEPVEAQEPVTEVVQSEAADVAEPIVSEPETETAAEVAAPEPAAEEAEAPAADAEAPVEAEGEPVTEVAVAEPEPAAPPKPKRRGWWSRGK